MQTNLAVHYRIPMLIVGFISLICGMYVGLIRLGWSLPVSSTTHLALHAPLMVCGFLGTVICLERAVAIGERWAYLAPLSSAVGVVLMTANAESSMAVVLIFIASALLSLVSLKILVKQRELFTFTLLLAALCWCIGCLLWLAGFSLARIMPWWIGFLIITIVGERLELSRFMRPSQGSKLLFILALLLFFEGATRASFSAWPNFQLLSVALVVMTLWLMRHDIVRHAIRQQGLTRYIAIALCSGYVWLLTAGIIGLSWPVLTAGSSYDAFSHSIFIGFVFSMIFGHAPLIFPAITKIKIPYHASFYLPLALLHTSLLARVVGDFLYLPALRKAGGLMHVVAITLFILVLATAALRNKKVGASTK
ncbi:hypothetical protein [Methylotenera mobilis]|uniref:NnrS family protein n=1 Tax=Methylotenera mobilis (strain JLW8 / ATCC BAA-1282 / DSM 17540) TaxID=583345 RepID=C6WVL7_METML|nr:hypothetical protein [Methylotenera mobilis]ACT47966.1 conserved hypothetical protein [Methylotenera mobilis JLW8]